MTGKTTKRLGTLTLLLQFAIGLALGQPPASEHVPGRLLVKPVDKTPDATITQLLSVTGARVHHKIDGIDVLVLDLPEPALDAVTRALESTGLFTFVERDHIAHLATTPNDPNFPSQWHLAKIQAASAWGITTGSASVPIAILDSGADSSHPDLAPKLIPGWNFLTGTSNTSDNGCNTGHGTAVSGAAGAATNNLTGVAGVGWANTIMPLVVVNSSCSANYSDIASAINYAADHGVRIISISIVGPTASSTLQSAVDYAWNKGAVTFAAAGNVSSSAPNYPAACNNAVAISATISNDTLASFSNYGTWIDLASPGDMILTTQMGGSYGYWYGTSLATPIAAAVGALALSANPALTASQLVTLLENNSDDLGAPGYDQYYGWGRVNAYKAVTAAKGVTADTKPPTISITAPLSGAVVLGTVSVLGTASDNVGVAKVELYVDGVLYMSGTSAVFSFSWNSTTKANGSHTLTAMAYDAAGNMSSASVTISVNNADTTPPQVAISSPLSGATVSGTVPVTGTATDNVGVTKLELYVDGTLYVSGTSAAFSFSWNSTTKANGSHTLTVKAYDAAGNMSSASLSVNVLTIVVDPPPTVTSLSPMSGAGTSQLFTFNFADTSGYTNLDVVNVLINPFLNGQSSCYLAYSRPSNVLYLFDNAGTALLPGMTLNGTGTLSNSRCTVFGAGTSASGVGNTLTLTLSMAFSQTNYAFDHVVYAAARNLTSGNSGWMVKGVWRVPKITPGSTVASYAPGSGTGTVQAFTMTLRDMAGATNISNAYLLINGALNGNNACYLGYVRATNLLYLVNDSNSGLLAPVSPNSGTGSAQNSQCILSGAGTTVTLSGTDLILTINLTFKPAFSGAKVAYAAFQNLTPFNTGWQARGVWTVP